MPKESQIVRRGQPVRIPWRDGGIEIPMTENRLAAFLAARAALLTAAQTGLTITYKQLATAIDNRFSYGQNHLYRLLDIISEDCRDRGEPSLAALVVTETDNDVGAAFIGDAATTRTDVWNHWA